ncbi:MAG: hypothetical protein F4Z34_07070 [Acidimicrobiaceae bacterium]|nr:hypothetical protein [Acidimicrobiaceae bacterium]
MRSPNGLGGREQHFLAEDLLASVHWRFASPVWLLTASGSGLATRTRDQIEKSNQENRRLIEKNRDLLGNAGRPRPCGRGLP